MTNVIDRRIFFSSDEIWWTEHPTKLKLMLNVVNVLCVQANYYEKKKRIIVWLDECDVVEHSICRQLSINNLYQQHCQQCLKPIIDVSVPKWNYYSELHLPDVVMYIEYNNCDWE